MIRTTLTLAGVLWCSALAARAAAPEGYLVLIGGGERPSYVMDRVAELAGGRSGRVLIVTLASSRPAEAADQIRGELETAGVGQVAVLDFDHETADDWETLERVNQATGIFFAGGDQSRLASVLRDTQLLERIAELYERGGVVAGTSAGATAVGSLMVTGSVDANQDPDRAVRSIRTGRVATEAGLGLMPDVIVDQHFIRRRRHNRLLSAALENPKLLAIGIDESTAIVVGPASEFEVLGENMVAVYDLSWASGVETDRNGNLAANGISLHLLRSGQVFDLQGRGVAP